MQWRNHLFAMPGHKLFSTGASASDIPFVLISFQSYVYRK